VSDLLEIESRREDGVVTIGASGELDIETARTLRAAIDEALDEPTIASLVLDLSGLTFCDSTGMETLVAASRLTRDGDVAFGIVRPSDDAAFSVFELSGLDDVLPFLDAA
jgi:anti-sigma B factor antagonist